MAGVNFQWTADPGNPPFGTYYGAQATNNVFSGSVQVYYAGFSAVPGPGAPSSGQAMFESSANLAASINGGSTALYGFRARTPTAVSPTLPNVYGVHVATQQTTNVTNGWGFVQTGANDGNVFAGPTTMASLSVTTGATCTAGTTSMVTLTVLNGIVTHC